MNTPTQPTEMNELPDLSGYGYIVRGIIATGGFGRVYEGWDESLKRQVAIKELFKLANPENPTEYREYRERFQHEAEQAGKFPHNKNIATVYHLVGEQYLILQYFKDGTLRDLLQRSGTLPLTDALRVAISLCYALEDIWKQKIVHRDIKPENIFLVLNEDGSVKSAALGDFGVALTSKHTTQLSRRIDHPGTPTYMSPEQETNKQYLDVRSDMYAVGLVLYEMLYGELYKFSSHASQGAVPAEDFSYVGSILNKLLQKEIEARYHTPAELREELEKVQARMRPSTAPVLLQPATSTRRRLFVATALVILALISSLAFFLNPDLFAGILGAGRTGPLPTNTLPAIVENPSATPTPTLSITIPGETEEVGSGGILTVTAAPTTETATATPTNTPTATPTLTATPTASVTPSPTLTPSPTATALPQLKVVRVTNQAFWYTGPGEVYPRMPSDLPLGETLLVLARLPEDGGSTWYLVSRSNSAIGWVSDSRTDPVSSAATTSIAAVPPPATVPPVPTPTPTFTPTPTPTPAIVTTLNTNLLVNPGAESGLAGWRSNFSGYTTRSENPTPHGGSRYFFAGPSRGVVNPVILEQSIDLSADTFAINNSLLRAVFGGYMRDFQDWDMSQIQVEFYDQNGTILHTEQSPVVVESRRWVPYEESMTIPPRTTLVKFKLISTYIGGEQNNDGYFDDVYFRVIRN